MFLEDTDGFGEAIEDTGASASQTVHLVADFGFDNAHTPHFQVSLPGVGTWRPALAQSKALTGGAVITTAVEEGGSGGVGTVKPSLGSSQTVHF